MDFKKKRWTTFCTLGNHEAYSLIESYPIVDFCGGKARKITDSLYYEIRGEIYNFNGKTFLSLGGADSYDKAWRKPDISWWKQETIIPQDIDKTLENLDKYNGKVDYILTHTGGSEVAINCGYLPTISDKRLDLILGLAQFKQHFCGHYHCDKIVNEHSRILYNDILEIS